MYILCIYVKNNYEHVYMLYILSIHNNMEGHAMTDRKDKLFTAKVEENLLEAFKYACESQDKTASQAVRAFMREYVAKYGQGDLFTRAKSKK